MKILITPSRLEGVIDAIPSKSHAHRVLIAQKLAQLQGQNKTDGLIIPTFSRDIEATKNCLVQLDKEMPFLDCKESGSTLRFLLPVTMALKSRAVFIGTGKLPDRPISPLKEEMECHGCTFEMGSKHQKISDKYKEICNVGGRLQPGEYHLAGNISSQFITGLIFALPLLDGDSLLKLTTPLESSGYVNLTLDVLKRFGIEIGIKTSDEGYDIYEIPGNQKYVEPDGLFIEGDWSNAAFWLACGALGGSITMRGLDMDSSQGDKEILNILKAMGADVAVTPPQNHDSASPTVSEITVKGRGFPAESTTNTAMLLQGIDVNVSQIPDMVPVLAAIMSVSSGTSMITNAERLKIKESDRLRTVYDFLSKLGADISYGGTGLSLTGKTSLTGGQVTSHNDHRIAMAAAVASCVCNDNVTIENAEAVKKSYPDFFKDFISLGGQAKEI